jgi:hypothetical protein
MKGKVIAVDPKRVFAGIQTDGGITPIEIIDAYDLELGEVIIGDLEGVGTMATLTKENGGSFSAFIQDCHCSRQVLRDVYKI